MLTDEIIALMKKRGTYLVPTAYLLSALPFDALPPLLAAKARQIIPLRTGESPAGHQSRRQGGVRH